MDITSTDTEIKNMVRASDKDAQYDEKAKRLLGHKYILAYILVNTVDEFKGMNPKDVVQYIEGEPLIGVVPVEPGMTNFPKDNPAEKGQMIINVEAQKDEPAGYVHLAYDKLIGDYQCKGRLDLLNIVMIGLSNELPEHDDKYELHRLLGALLSKQLSADEKLAIIEQEYDTWHNIKYRTVKTAADHGNVVCFFFAFSGESS